MAWSPFSGTAQALVLQSASRPRSLLLLSHARELDELAGAEHADLEGGARRQGGQFIANLFDILLGHDWDTLDREDDVTAQGYVPSTDSDDPVAPGQPHLRGHRILGDRLDQEPGRRRDIQQSGEVPGEERALEGTPEHLPLHQDLFRGVDGHSKAQAFATAGFRDVLTDDADLLASGVEHGTAGVARIDRGCC